MKVTVLGGSPKGEKSVTMQYVRYLEKRYPEHAWSVIQIASRIALLEESEARLNEVMSAVREADLVLWAFPLYYMTVCSQYKRFIELVESRSLSPAFSGTYAAALSTSIRFFDHTAHVYIREISEDWGMSFVASFSAAMNDLTKRTERVRLDAFAEQAFAVVGAKLPCPRRSVPLYLGADSASPAHALTDASPPPRQGPRTGGPRTAVLVDYPEAAAGRMADRFVAAVERSEGSQVDRIDLGTLGLEHGCLGCLRCGAEGRCAYEGRDDFIETFRTRVMGADILVFAGSVRDRLLSARWKAFLDRSFFNTHKRSLAGKRVVVLVAGPLSRLANLRETLSAYFEWQGAHLIEFVSDEAEAPEELAALIDGAADRAALSLKAISAAASAADTVPPATFLGVGGMKIFRDEVFGGLRIVFKADHREYRETGVYDFPLRNPFARLGVWLASWITSIPFIQRGMRENMIDLMLKPYRKVLAETVARSS